MSDIQKGIIQNIPSSKRCYTEQSNKIVNLSRVIKTNNRNKLREKIASYLNCTINQVKLRESFLSYLSCTIDQVKLFSYKILSEFIICVII